METRNITLDLGRIKILSDHYGIKISDIFREAEGGPSIDLAMLQAHRVPVLQWDEIISWMEPKQREKLRANRPTFLAPPPATENFFALTIVDDSMQSAQGVSFPQEFTILIDPNRSPAVGDYVIALPPGGRATFKQLLSDGLDQYLRPLNRDYRQAPLGDAKILGAVTEARWIPS